LKIFTNIILNELINFIEEQTNELQSLKIDPFINIIEESDLFANINIYNKKEEKKLNEWDIINEQANKSILENNRLNQLYAAVENIDKLAEELSKNENFEELNTLESQLAEEKYNNEEEQQIKQILQQYYEQEHTEITLPEFLNINKTFNTTQLIHDFQLDGKSEYDIFADSHYAFISDFFPVNNIDISSLLKEVRKSIQQNKITPATNIYKAWIKYLRDNNCDYYIYDWNNFNDQGQYISNQSNHIDLDQYIMINENIIIYDELSNKKQEEEKFNQYVKQVLSDGSYKPNFKELQLAYKQAKDNVKELYANK